MIVGLKTAAIDEGASRTCIGSDDQISLTRDDFEPGILQVLFDERSDLR